MASARRTAIWLAVLLCARSVTARAHGDLPAALEPLVMRSQRALMVQLNVGLARREGETFRLLCAEQWGGDESAPSAALPSGLVVVAAPSGLFLVDDAGRVSAHPAASVGRGYALARVGEVIYGLFDHDSASQLARISAQDFTPVFETAELLTSLHATGERIQLVGATDKVLTQVVVSPDGTELSRAHATLDDYPLFVEARDAVNERTVVRLQRDSQLRLGTMQDSRFVAQLEAQTLLEGPLQVDAQTLVVVDGALVALAGELSAGMRTVEYLNGLGSLDGHPYVRVRDGLRALDAEGLGTRLFRWEQLREPNWRALSDTKQQTACRTRWYHLSVDLVAAGMIDTAPPEDDEDAAPSRTGHCSGLPSSSARSTLTWLLTACMALAVRRRLHQRAHPRRSEP